MTEAEAIRKSIDHWERMIAWVETQPEFADVRYDSMLRDIGAYPSGTYCALCLYSYDNMVGCDGCILAVSIGRCEGEEITNAWGRTFRAETWDQWLKHAGIMWEQLKSLEKGE